MRPSNWLLRRILSESLAYSSRINWHSAMQIGLKA